MAGRAVPFKRSLLINLTAGVALLGTVMLALSLIATRQSVARLSGILTDQVIATTDARIMGFFEPIMAEIEIAAERTRLGEFERFPLAELDAYFEPLISNMEQVSSVMYSHGNGDEYMLLYSQGGWRSRLSRPESRGSNAIVRAWKGDDTQRPPRQQTVDYDARGRPWFDGAIDTFQRLGEQAPLADRIHWTEPYRFFTTQEPGITASLAHRSDTGRLIVLGFDILLTDISRFTSRLTIGESGLVFVLRGSPEEPEGLAIIGLPADERLNDGESLLEFVLSPPFDFGGPVASYVMDALVDGRHTDGAVRFAHDGKPWWGGIAPSRLRGSTDIWVGAVVPERELLEGLPNTNLIVVLVTGALLLLAIAQASRLAYRFSAPVEALTEQANRMQRLDFEPAQAVDAPITEIRHLSTTLERMRSALQSFTSTRDDIRIAHSIRRQQLPATIAAPAGLDCQVWQHPSEELGGEFFDVIRVAPRREGQADATVVGLFDFPLTGLAAAIASGQLQTEFRAAVATHAGDLPAVAARLDDFIREQRPAYGPLRGLLLHIAEGGAIAMLGFGWDAVLWARRTRVSRIAPAPEPLGLKEPATIAEREPLRLDLAPGDTLVAASDGVLDALSKDRRRYRLAGLEQAMRACSDQGADAVIRRVAADLQRHTAGVPGDRTLLAVQRARTS